METDTKKARKWDAEKEEIDDHEEKQAQEALEELKTIEAIEVVKTSLKTLPSSEGKRFEILFKTIINLF